MNLSLVISSMPLPKLSQSLPCDPYDRDSYTPSILTYERYQSIYGGGGGIGGDGRPLVDIYAIHFFSVRQAIINISIIGPGMQYIYSRREKTKNKLPVWTGLPPKFNDSQLIGSIAAGSILVFTDLHRLHKFRDIFCLDMPQVRYCLLPPNEVDRARGNTDDIVIHMANYYRVYQTLYNLHV